MQDVKVAVSRAKVEPQNRRVAKFRTVAVAHRAAYHGFLVRYRCLPNSDPQVDRYSQPKISPSYPRLRLRIDGALPNPVDRGTVVTLSTRSEFREAVRRSLCEGMSLPRLPIIAGQVAIAPSPAPPTASIPPPSAIRVSSLRSDDATASQPKKLEVVSKQATKVTALSTKLEWKIDQFEKLMKLFKNGQNLISRQFGVPQAPTVCWELHVYPNGKREEDMNNVSFFLRQVGLQRGEEPIMTEFQIYALDVSSQRVSVCRDTKDFTNQQGRGKFQVSRDKMAGALRADGSLLLICEVEYFTPGSKISVEPADDEECTLDDVDEKVELSIRESNREMWESELFTDCVIKVGSKEIKAHRCVLGQHSPVFRSMFNNESMIEAREGIIDIQDAKYESVRAMVEFMYTGSMDTVDSNSVDEVLAIADKYEVLPLKEQCERIISNTITQKNITSIAVFADTYTATLLKQAVIRYLTVHHKNIIRTPEWRAMKKDRYELANELLEAVLSASGDMDEENMSNSSKGPARKRVRRCVNTKQ